MKDSQHYIPLMDMEFIWKFDDVEKVINLYKKNMNIKEMRNIIKRPTDEIAILLMDLGRKGVI